MAGRLSAGHARLRRRSELQGGVALRDRRRVDRHADVVAHPCRGTPRGLVGSGLVLADRHGRPAVAGAKGGVADEAGNRADEFAHLWLALLEGVEELLRAVAAVLPDGRVHAGLLRLDGPTPTAPPPRACRRYRRRDRRRVFLAAPASDRTSRTT